VARNSEVACVGCLDASFVGHLDSDAIVGGFCIVARCGDEQKMASAASIGYGIGVDVGVWWGVVSRCG
jgi:hypothetical protein